MSAKDQTLPPVPLTSWLTPVALAWLFPGAGHFYLKRNLRGALICGAILLMFLLGLSMRGYLFEAQTGDVLTTLIYTGGFIGNLAAGLPYILSRLFGYSQPDVAGHVFDYGTKFLVTAGLLNILAMVDAYEIATHHKD